MSKSVGIIAVAVGCLSLSAPAVHAQTPLSITTTSLPGGRIGLFYSYPLNATGGNGTYTWSVAPGGLSLPNGISFLQNPNRLEGTPSSANNTASSVFGQVTLRVTSGTATADRVFQIYINPANVSLAITTDSLPNGQFGRPYPNTIMQATGGTGYVWEMRPLVSGLPPGLTLTGAGTLAGTPTAAGVYSLSFTLGAAGGVFTQRTYFLTIAAPTVNLTLSDPAKAPNAQTTIAPTLSASYPTALTGRLRLTYTSSATNTANDPAFQFSNGSREIDFTTPANSTAINVTGGLRLQNGTTAGEVVIELVSLISGPAQFVTTPQEIAKYSISQAVPVITAATVVSKNASAITLQIRGYSTSRALTHATFTFTAAGGTAVTNANAVSIETVANNHYRQPASAATGGTFNYDQTFSVTGTGGADATSLNGVNITINNAQGSSTTRTVTF